MADRGALRIQSVADCVVDIAAHDGLTEGLVTADAALHLRCVSREDLDDALARYGARRGARLARRVVALADGRIESPGESVVRLLAWHAGLRLVPQVTILDHDGGWVARVDFIVEGTRVIVEFDGLGKYRRDRDLQEEKRRQVALERLGYTVVRVLSRDLGRPDRLVALLRDAVARTCPAAA